MELHITGLCKTYPNGVAALNDVTLTIGHGMFGLLGPNGAGKSTLMRILATLQDADRGSVQLQDGERFIDVLRDKSQVRSLLGYLPQDFGVYPKMSAATLLSHLAELKGVAGRGERHDMVEALLVKTNLWGDRAKALGTFSGGMRQRFGIAQALIGAPRLLIVDEPTAGLDPEERVRFHNLLAEVGEEVVVLLSTHIVADIADLCPELAVLNRGQVLVFGAPSAIAARLSGSVYARSVLRGEVEQLALEHRVISTRLKAGRTVVHIIAHEPPGAAFEPIEATLEDAYFAAIAGLLPGAGAPLAEASPGAIGM
jgi:ABC-2 type transport system ATP-binding protein